MQYNLPQFIEAVYNEKRRHSSIDYLTPNELELLEKQGDKDLSQFKVDL